MGGVNKWDEAGDAVRSVIRAYHGSPHDFDRFDASKIGTGEGAQSYGHGLYFAQNPSVAQEYKKQVQLFRPNTDGAWSKRTISDAEDSVAKAGSREEAIRHLNILLESVAEDLSLRPQVEDAIAYLQNGKPPKPRLYEVEIDHPEEALLDLDSHATGEHKAALLGAAFEAPENKWQRMAIQEIADRDTRSKVATESLLRAYNSTTGDPMLHRAASAAKVADSLFRNGIPGARYFDESSRSAGYGTRNYVMFPGTEDSIRILRKYAIPGAVGTGVASQYEEER